MDRIEFTDFELKKCIEFATKMRGKHNPDMIMDRVDWEIFRDDLRGKLGEIAVLKEISTRRGIKIDYDNIDFSVSDRGMWDITDLEIDHKKINVKAIRHNSEFLLVEQKRYNKESGEYAYKNNDGEMVSVNIYALARVALYKMIDGKKIDFSENDYKLILEKNLEERVSLLKEGRTIYAENLGAIDHNDFWCIKREAESGILCSKENLKKVWEMQQPVVATGTQKLDKNKTLQVDNYVIAVTGLTGISNLLVETYEDKVRRKKRLVSQLCKFYSTYNEGRYKKYMRCPLCGEGILVKRVFNDSIFLGCTNFAKKNCRFTVNL